MVHDRCGERFPSVRQTRTLGVPTTDTLTSVNLQDLLARYASDRDRALEAELTAAYAPLARHVAKRFIRSRDDADDVHQVALFALVKALRRWEPERGVAFSTYAWATMSGEIKRYRRSTAWAVHVPRSLQEAHLRTAGAIEHLTRDLGRSPTIAEIATHTGDSADVIVAALEAKHAVNAVSIDTPVRSRDGELADEPMPIGAHDPAFDRIENSDFVTALLARLPARDRELVRLRFVDNLNQTEIGERLGMSQMHVSRLLTRALGKLRAFADGAA